MNKSIYSRWKGMKYRCYNSKCSKCSKYSRYGGRGITVCDEWKHNPKAFEEWAVANGFSAELQIDRRDNNGPYSPENCRWVTHTENQQNKERKATPKPIKPKTSRKRQYLCACNSKPHLPECPHGQVVAILRRLGRP